MSYMHEALKPDYNIYTSNICDTHVLFLEKMSIVLYETSGYSVVSFLHYMVVSE